MSKHSLRRSAPLLICLYTALAAAWGWRLNSQATAVQDPAIEQTRLTVVKRLAKLPQRRMQPAFFQLGMLPDAEVLALANWLQSPPVLRMRQVTIQQGPIHAPSPLMTALLLAEMQRPDAPSVDEMRLLVAASGDRIEEPVKMEALHILSNLASKQNDRSLATDILLRACDSPAATWDDILALTEVARSARRPAAALRFVNLWLGDADVHLSKAQLPQALDLQCTLLIEGGRIAEASRICLEALRALPPSAYIPAEMLDRALRATSAAGETAELAPWIERQLRSYPEHQSTWQQLAQGQDTTAAYRHWLYHAACIADRQHASGSAGDLFFRVVAAGDLRPIGRLNALANQLGLAKDFAQMLDILQQRPSGALNAIQLAKALADGSARDAARELLAAQMKRQPADHDTAFALTEIDEQIRGSAPAALLWEGFLKRFPDDVPALQRLSGIHLANGQPAMALRTLQRIPEQKLEDRDLRQIAALGEQMDEIEIVGHARQLIVSRQEKPAVSDLLALAAVGPQLNDPDQSQHIQQHIAAQAANSPFLASLLSQRTREGSAAVFSTAAEQVRPAIEVKE